MLALLRGESTPPSPSSISHAAAPSPDAAAAPSTTQCRHGCGSSSSSRSSSTRPCTHGAVAGPLAQAGALRAAQGHGHAYEGAQAMQVPAKGWSHGLADGSVRGAWSTRRGAQGLQPESPTPTTEQATLSSMAQQQQQQDEPESPLQYASSGSDSGGGELGGHTAVDNAGASAGGGAGAAVGDGISVASLLSGCGKQRALARSRAYQRVTDVRGSRRGRGAAARGWITDSATGKR